MGRHCLLWLLSMGLISTFGKAQDSSHTKFHFNYVSIALTNNQSAYPFSAFTDLVAGEWHPGFEVGTGFNWKSKPHHDWYQEFRLGYFFHQFVQQSITLYTSFGYRYNFDKRFSAQLGLGAGYLHSIPNHDRAKLNADSVYEIIHDIGRPQLMVVLNIGLSYKIATQSRHPLHLFMTWQQRIQTPFINSYVPILPYNTLMFGVKRSIAPKKK